MIQLLLVIAQICSFSGDNNYGSSTFLIKEQKRCQKSLLTCMEMNGGIDPKNEKGLLKCVRDR